MTSYISRISRIYTKDEDELNRNSSMWEQIWLVAWCDFEKKISGPL